MFNPKVLQGGDDEVGKILEGAKNKHAKHTKLGGSN